MIIELIDYAKKYQIALKRWCYGGLVAVIIWSIIVIDTHHVHTWLEKIPGFWSLFTLIAIFLLVCIARWFAKSGIEVHEEYYDR